MRFLLALTAVALLAGCIPKSNVVRPEPRPAPRPAAAAQPSPPPVADWRDAVITPGTWVYSRDVRGTQATFGGGTATLRCDMGARRVVLALATGPGTPITIRTTSKVSAVVPQAAAANGLTTLNFAANDPLLDAMAFSRGRFAVEQAGRATLYIPAYAEVGRVVQDCRGG